MSKQCILLVDDEPDAVEFLRDLLEDNGYTVLTASSARAGLACARKYLPNLICLDVLMPEESGMSLYQKLRTDSALKKTPVVITSGMSFNKELRQIVYLELPDGTTIPEPDGIAEKPIDIEHFMTLVRRVVT